MTNKIPLTISSAMISNLNTHNLISLNTKENIGKDKFECKNCGHIEHSDYNSPKTILNRCLEDVLLNKLSDFDEYERMIPNKVNHKIIKNIVLECYNFDTEVLVS